MDLADLLAAKQMVVLSPEGGITSTSVPYNMGQNEKILDYFCLSRGVIGHSCIEHEWVIASEHLALNREVLCTDSTSTAFEPEAEDVRDPRRFVKRRRRRAPRRRWPGWREEVTGQFAALLPDGVWDSVHRLQRGMLWAARAAVASQKRASRWTPYDVMERHFLQGRRVTRGRDARRVLSKWILQVRAYQS